ncbi:MAG: aryl-sulfate sulfotransferase [Bacilli bacterium]|nr:aryl-sulfate sulfotransferase [Bacilli bacterium]
MRKRNKKNVVLVTIIAIALIVTLALIVYILVKNPNRVLENGEPINENFTFLIESGDATEVKTSDLIKEQREMSQDILKMYKKGKYTITNPLVISDPYGASPLTALIMFNTSKNEKVKLTVKGKHNDDLKVTFESSKDHYIPVYGLYPEYKNTVIIETESGKSNTLTIETSSMGLTGEVTVLTNSIGNSNGNFYFGTAAIGTANIAYDSYGEPRWFLLPDYGKGMTMLSNGHLLLSSTSVGPEINSAGGMIEVDMFGFVHHEYDLTGGYHHEAYEMENGDIVVLTGDVESKTLEDVVSVIDRKTGTNKKVFKLYDIVSGIDPNMIGDEELAWAWLNGVYYDKNTNELLLSFRNRNSVVALDYDSGNIKWILGDSKYWSSAFDKYILKGVGSNFTYPMGQHSPSIDANHNLSLFNNGYNAYKEETHTCGYFRNSASYAMVYKIDEENMTAEVTYKFGGTEYFSYALSSYNQTFDGRTLFNSGWHFSDEVNYEDPSCTQFNNDKYVAYIIEFDENKDKILELKVNESKFEVIKANIYNLSLSSVKPQKYDDIPNYEFNDNAYFTTNNDTKNYEELTETEALKYKNTDEKIQLSFEVVNRQFSFVGLMPDEFDIKVTFISTRGKAYRYTLKEANKEMKVSVNLSSLPKGRYYVYADMGNKVYDTREYVEIS